MYTEDDRDNESMIPVGDDNYDDNISYDEPVEDNYQQNSSNKSKQLIIIIILLIVLAVLIFLLVKSCDNGNNGVNNNVNNNSVVVELSTGSLELKVNDNYKIEYTVSNYNGLLEVTWISSDESVVNVSNDGTVTALMVGTANVIASYFIDNVPYEKTCLVTVIENNGINVNDNVKPVLNYTIDNGKDNAWGNNNVIINVKSSDNSGVVDVKYALNCTKNCDYNDVKNGVIEIKNEGSTIVTIVASDKNNNSVSKTVTIKIDKSKPTCELSVNENGLLTAKYSDKGDSKVSYYGFSSNYSGTSEKEKNVTEGDYKFYVKDNAGNTNSCSIEVVKKTQYRYQDCTSCNTCSAGGCASLYWKAQSGGITYSGSCSTKFPIQVGNTKYISCSATSGTASGCNFYCSSYAKLVCSSYNSSCESCGCSSWGNFTEWSDSVATESSSRKIETRSVYAKK